MNEDAKLQAQLNKHKKLTSDWTELKREHYSELFECLISQETLPFKPSIFITIASRHVDAALLAFKFENSHSLAIQVRTLYELVNRYDPIRLFVVIDNPEVQITLGNIFLENLRKITIAAMRLNPDSAKHIQKTAENFSNSFKVFIAENHKNEKSFTTPIPAYNVRYSPNLKVTTKILNTFLDKNYTSDDEEFVDFSKKYTALSKNFFHPNTDTLTKTTIFGGINKHPSNDQVLTYNLWLLNNALAWIIWMANLLIDIDTHFFEPISKRQHHSKFDPKLKSIDPEVDHFINFMTNLITEYQQLYESHLEYLSSDVNNKSARLHKFYIHSSSANLLSKTLNLDASCVELSVMHHMLRECGIKFDKPHTDAYRFNIYKHPMLFHFGFNVFEGGNQFSSINQLATIMAFCIFSHFQMWQFALNILLEICDKKKTKSLLFKHAEITQSAEKYQGVFSKIMQKHSTNFKP